MRRLWLNPVGVSDLESEATSDLRMMAISAKPLSIRKIPARKTHMYVDTAWELSPTVAVRLMQQNPAARVLVAR